VTGECGSPRRSSRPRVANGWLSDQSRVGRVATMARRTTATDALIILSAFQRVARDAAEFDFSTALAYHDGQLG
jgi:hypothetical protein